MKTSELTDIALDWAVCEASGLLAAYPKVRKSFKSKWQGNSTFFIHPSADWAQAGLIIEREGIATCTSGVGWEASKFFDINGEVEASVEYGPTLLIAAMRCFVASKLGDEIDIPEELLK